MYRDIVKTVRREYDLCLFKNLTFKILKEPVRRIKGQTDRMRVTIKFTVNFL